KTVPDPFGPSVNEASVHAQILRELEQAPLYDAINFDLPCVHVEDFALGNATAATRVVDVFLCPSDPNPRAAPFGPNSFRANIGMGEDRIVGTSGGSPLVDNYEDGAFSYRPILPLAAFTDGTSNTLA